MRDRLLGYYERELAYLRQLGAEFAEKYPKIASRLTLEPDRCEDPHVERLLEGVALLNAKLRHKLDDELPELTDSVLGILYPHYLAPVPSMTIAQFQADPAQAQLAGLYEIPQRTTLTTRPVRGVRCRFRTVFPVELWPIDVIGAELETPPGVNPMAARRTFVARSLVRLQLKAIGDAKIGDLPLKRLRFFIEGDHAQAAELYELLCAAGTQVELHGARHGAAAPGVVLPPDSIRPVGFARDEMMLPYPPRSFRGYCLLQEYFCFPRKFLFFDIVGLEALHRIVASGAVEVRIFSERPAAAEARVGAENFRLGCTPVVNLFEKPAEPIWVDHTKEEYLVVPDVHGQDAHEVYSIDSVVGIEPGGGERVDYEPFYGFRHGIMPDAQQTFWHGTRRDALDGATNVYLTLLDARFRLSTPPIETLTVRTTCTNRDLPAAVPFSGRLGEDLDSEDIAPFVHVRVLGKPTPTRRIATGRGAHWRLVSHLSLNYLSIVDSGVDALQGILDLYDFDGSAAAKRQIAGIVGVQSARLVRNVNGAFSRGRKVTIQFDEGNFVGSGAYLFASILEVFLGLYSSVNSFTQLVAVSLQREDPIRTWPPRAGEQVLI